MRISDWSSDVCSSDLVVRGIGVIGGHVGAHDARGVTSDVEAGAELVLGAHTGDAFAADAVPGAVIVADEAAGLRHVLLIAHHLVLFRRWWVEGGEVAAESEKLCH